MDQPTILFADDWLVVINKPAGWVVHEGAGETGETIVDWFVKHFPEVKNHQWLEPNRMGIVHRLDKDTSGVMVLARTPHVLAALQQQFQERTTEKIYQALVYGEPKEESGRIETFIGRHPKRRQEQAVLPIQVGERARREAITDYQVKDVFPWHHEIVSLIEFHPRTGRMHQLRVHAKYLGTPILGDQTYTIKPAKRLSKSWDVHRQLLHASSLRFLHPETGLHVQFEAPLPEDMQVIIAKLAVHPTK